MEFIRGRWGGENKEVEAVFERKEWNRDKGCGNSGKCVIRSLKWKGAVVLGMNGLGGAG